MTADVELLPCPFCGHVPQDWPDFLHQTGGGWRDDSRGDGTTFRHYMRDNDPRGVHGKCWELGCLTHEGGCGATVVGDSRDEAIAAWNRRATAAQDAEIEALRAEVDQAQASARVWRRLAETCDARAERLAEAGRRVTAAFRAHGEATPFTREAERTRHECEAAMLALDATTLHPTAAQGDEAASA